MINHRKQRTAAAAICAGLAWLLVVGTAADGLAQGWGVSISRPAPPKQPAATAEPASTAPEAAVPEERKVSSEPNDPLEGLNRITSGFNWMLRQLVIDPVIDGYQAITPDEVQDAVSNVVSNLTEPLTAVSSLVQGDFENAGTAAGRFIVNTTVGIGGIRDPATGYGMEQRREDLGQALGAHGVPAGPHLVLPIIGPSNLRDAPGDILAGIISPIPLAGQVGTGMVTYSEKQDAVRDIIDSVIDPYIVERNAYEQRRDFVVHNGRNFPVPDIGEIE